MKTKTVLILSSVLMLALLCGCMNLSKPQLLRSYFVLDMQGNQEHGDIALTPGRPCLLIRNITISPLFSGKEFVYRLTDDQYESDYYNLFFTTPAGMLRELMADALSDSTTYNLIHGTATRINPSYDLEIYVTRLYGDFRILTEPKGNIEMMVYLIHEEENVPRVVLSKSYSAAKPMKKRTAAQLVKAWEQGMGDILASLDADISQAVVHDEK